MDGDGEDIIYSNQRRITCSKVPTLKSLKQPTFSMKTFWKVLLSSFVEIKNSKATPTILQPTVKISFELARPPPLAQIITLVPTSTNNHQTLSQSTRSTQNPNVNVSRLLTFFVRHHKNNIQTSSCQHHTSACTVPPSCQHSSNIDSAQKVSSLSNCSCSWHLSINCNSSLVILGKLSSSS